MATDIELKLDFDDFRRFFAAKYKNVNCPVCEEAAGVEMLYNPWAHDPKKPASYLSLAHGRNALNTIPVAVDLTSFASPVLPLACNNCGYLQLFSVNTIARWAEKNPAEHHRDGSAEAAADE